MSARFKREISKALKNDFVRNALQTFSSSYIESREAAFAGKDFEQLQEEIVAIKQSAQDHLEDLIKIFEKSASARGSVVYHAASASNAVDLVIKIIRQHNGQKVIKSKSMTSEEIGLNETLGKIGIEVIETDLGERIAQLASEKPSHMVLPVIHQTRREVANIFSVRLGKEVPPDIPRLVEEARNMLHQDFLSADIGITGANAVIAQSGAIMIMSNEGNARLVASLPHVHIVIAGYDKIVPDLESALRICDLLPKCATGQKITSYVSFIAGPPRKHQYIIFLDNGRREMFKDQDFHQAGHCIRCGACLNVCPTYLLLSGHVFGHIYMGGIGIITTAFHHGYRNAADISTLCIGCRRCVSFCPAKIDVPELIVKLRQRITEKQPVPAAENLVFRYVVKNRTLFHALMRIASHAQSPFVSEGQYVRHLPFFFAAQFKSRSLPALAPKPLRDKTPYLLKRTGRSRPKVTFFSGCLIEFVYVRIGEAVFKVLHSFDVEVEYPRKQGCCGFPALLIGESDTARQLAIRNIKAFEQSDSDYIVTACPACTVMLKNRYPELLSRSIGNSQLSRDWPKKIFLLPEFLAQVLKITEDSFRGSAKSELRVTYHDSCHLARELKTQGLPRYLLQEIAKFNLVEMKDSDVCCGFGGTFSFKHPEISAAIVERKAENIRNTGASVVATDCPGCLLQLRGVLNKMESAQRAFHTIELLADRLGLIDV
jgi:iron-sulfur cluster protein